jgi:rRNA biogenesis protein RRP5
MSLLPHIIDLDVAKTSSGQIPLEPLEALPVGFIVESVKVIEVMEDQGVYVDIGLENITGFVHVHPQS